MVKRLTSRAPNANLVGSGDPEIDPQTCRLDRRSDSEIALNLIQNYRPLLTNEFSPLVFGGIHERFVSVA